MKKLLMTTALVTVMAAPAVAQTDLVGSTRVGESIQNERVETRTNPDGSITETTITETITPRESVSMMVTSEVSAMDLLKRHDWDGDGSYDHKHTVITIEGMTPEEFTAMIGDQTGDGRVTQEDLNIFVGDANNDGVIDFRDYVERFGENTIRVRYTYDYPPDYDGTTAFLPNYTPQDVVVDRGVNLRTSQGSAVTTQQDSVRTTSRAQYDLNR